MARAYPCTRLSASLLSHSSDTLYNLLHEGGEDQPWRLRVNRPALDEHSWPRHAHTMTASELSASKRMALLLNASEMNRVSQMLALLSARREEVVRLCKPADAEQVRLLKANGNSCEDWSQLLLGPLFDPDQVHGSQFLGHCVLMGPNADSAHNAKHDIGAGVGAEPGSGYRPFPAGIYNSTLQDCVVDHSVALYHCPALVGYSIGHGCSITASRLVATPPEHRIDSPELYAANALSPTNCVEAGLETGGRSLPFFPEITLELAGLIAENPGDPDCLKVLEQARSTRSTQLAEGYRLLGPDSWINHCQLLRNSFVAGTTVIDGAEYITESVLLSAVDSGTRVSGGAGVAGSVLQEGVTVDSGARVRSSILLSGSGAEDGARIRDCLIAGGTVVAAGEATASFIGPFVGMHHSSLLIAAYWPEGRGNLGYGANVGSNHTSRMPDQEIHPGEGMFFGLDTVVKFPAHFRRAPYTVLASGVTTLPQRLELPFSLILEDTPPPGAGSGLTRIIPGWMLRENLYAVIRSEHKLKRRAGSFVEKDFNPSPFRPSIAEFVRAALIELRSLPEAAWYLPKDLAALGKNYMRGDDLAPAIAAYEDYLTVVEGRELAQEKAADHSSLTAEQRQLFLRYIDILGLLPERAAASRRKDMDRGMRIIPDYGSTHLPPEQEPLLQEFQLEVARELEQAKDVLTRQ